MYILRYDRRTKNHQCNVIVSLVSRRVSKKKNKRKEGGREGGRDRGKKERAKSAWKKRGEALERSSKLIEILNYIVQN